MSQSNCLAGRKLFFYLAILQNVVQYFICILVFVLNLFYYINKLIIDVLFYKALQIHFTVSQHVICYVYGAQTGEGLKHTPK